MSERTEVTLIAGKPARYRVRRSDRAKRLTLHIDSRDGLVVVLPRRVPAREVGAMLAEHAAWIDRQLEKYGVREGPLRREYTTGSRILFLGQPRRLEIEVSSATRRRSHVSLAGDILTARLTATDVLDPKPVLVRWFQRQSRALIRERVPVMAQRIGLQPGKIMVGERTSRWGSCSGQGTLSFCFRLVMAPLPVIDAVVAHEICHLRHLNHSRRFYRLLRLACPDYAEQMAWLEAHERDLEL